MLIVVKSLPVLCLMFAVLAHPSIGCAAGYGFDVGVPPAVHAAALSEAGIAGRQGEWMRVRGVTDPADEKSGDARTVVGDRAGLAALRARGIKTAVFLRWEPTSWAAGVRGGGGHRMPLDLREAYERGRRLGAAYGDLVDAWEIDNEPDIGFVADNPEVFTAFHKAVYLGLKNGASASAAAASLSLKFKLKEQSPESTWLAQKRGWAGLQLKLSSSTGGAITTPRVVMAPLALPPGPYLERLWDNGIASYTDGFNFHYYGYAQDFSGVYGQFRDAVTRLDAESSNARRAGKGGDGRLRVGSNRAFNLKLKISSDGRVSRTLPVFITEYGYGLLDAEARNLVEGRVRQWRWFRDVVAQVRDLRIAAPMAFYWNPYYEANLNEFGLTTEREMGFRSSAHETHGIHGSSQKESEAKDEGRDGRILNREGREEARSEAVAVGDQNSQRLALNSQLGFTPTDFGANKSQPWMERIGKRVGDAYASPALAYLWDYAERHSYEPRDWSVHAEPAGPVVIDFVAGRGLEQAKVSGGYVVTGHDDVGNYVLAGRGVWVVYNFSAETIRGRLEIQGDGAASSVESQWLTLAPGERREISGLAGVQAQSYRGSRLGAVFGSDDRKTVAVWSTRLLPTDEWMGERRLEGFDFESGMALDRRLALERRKLAEGEPPMRAQGRWLATDGVRVEEADGVWRFHVDMLPAEPLTPAIVELALPEGFTFGPGEIVMLEQRLGTVAGAAARQMKMEDDVEGGRAEGVGRIVGGPEVGESEGRMTEGRRTEKGRPADAARMRSRAGMAGDRLDVCFRTENGNLYQTWPRLRAGGEWATYRGAADDFTMAFFGRAHLPWRLSENKPASLVFRLRPSQIPAVFEVRDARVVKIERLE